MRISLAGGGTDLPSYYLTHGGAVLSFTIDVYARAFFVDSALSVEQAMEEISKSGKQGPRPPGVVMTESGISFAGIVRSHFSIDDSVRLHLISDVPPGSGLGFSSAAMVATVRACSRLLGHAMTPEEVAETSCMLEARLGKNSAGKQDAYAAAFRGINWISFLSEGIHVAPLDLPGDTFARLLGRLMLFFTGRVRRASALLEEYNVGIAEKQSSVLDALHEVKHLAHQLRSALMAGNVAETGEILRESWIHKKRFAKDVSSPDIDAHYEAAIENGAVGGKILGAGQAGYLLLYCEPEAQGDVERVMQQRGLTRLHFGASSPL